MRPSRSKRRPAPCEVAQRGGGRREVGAGEPRGGERRGRVAGVVGARDGQLDLDAVEREARAAGGQLGRGVERHDLEPGGREREQRPAGPRSRRPVGQREERAEGVVDVAL